MNAFFLERKYDPVTKKPAKIIAEGVVFTDGAVAMRFVEDGRITAQYESIDQVKRNHGWNGLREARYVNVHVPVKPEEAWWP